MPNNRPIFSYATLLLLILVAAISLLESCANIIPPLGGAKDTLPPRAIAINPKDSTLQFKGQRIVLNFDEYVQLDQIQQNLLVSPTPKINPIVESRLRTVTIRIKDTLEPNTTYVINFGNAIRDVNENNPLRNFRYVFSTGNYIDSMELTGKVILAETGKTDSTITVMLHRSMDDSAVVKEKPRYYTRVDSAGNYRFQNLAPGTYSIYAVKDEGGSNRYMSPNQLFAFADQAVVIAGETEPVTLYAYAEPELPKTPKAAATPAGRKKGEADQDRRLRYNLNLEGGLHDVLKQITFSFAEPLKTFDSSKLQLTDDQFRPLSGYSLVPDSTGRLYTLHYAWPLDQPFNLLLEKGLAEDSSGKGILKSDTIAFRTMKESDYGSIKFRFANIDTTRKPVLQLVQNDKIMFSYRIRGKELIIPRFRPAEFELRMLYDENDNGKWDFGNFFGTKRQPEKVQSIGKKINIKGNWDNEIDITL